MFKTTTNNFEEDINFWNTAISKIQPSSKHRCFQEYDYFSKYHHFKTHSFFSSILHQLFWWSHGKNLEQPSFQQAICIRRRKFSIRRTSIIFKSERLFRTQSHLLLVSSKTSLYSDSRNAGSRSKCILWISFKIKLLLRFIEKNFVLARLVTYICTGFYANDISNFAFTKKIDIE